MTRPDRSEGPVLPPRGTPVTWFLEQETYWRGQDGRPYRVETMDQEHRVALLAYLRRSAARLREHALWVELDLIPGLDVDNLGDLAPQLGSTSALAWLNDRPLIGALERAVARHEALDGEVVPNARELDSRGQLRSGGDGASRLEG